MKNIFVIGLMSLSYFATANALPIQIKGKSQTCWDYLKSSVSDSGGSAENHMRVNAINKCGQSLNAVQVTETVLTETSVCVKQFGETYIASAKFNCVKKDSQE